MPSPYDLLEDEALVQKIKKRLPYLFYLAEKKISRKGTTGMEVGTLREQILIALFIHKFGRENVQLERITGKHDVRVLGYPISIKTAKAKPGTPSLKVWWGSDNQKAKELKEQYRPSSILMAAIIKWGGDGELALIPKEVQEELFEEVGAENYLKISTGTNNRGVAIPGKIVSELLRRSEKKISIRWQVPSFNSFKEDEWTPYLEWLEYWEKPEDPPFED